MARWLIACEYSGRTREAFRAKGHDVISCDLLPSEDNSPFHIVGDVFDVIAKEGPFDGMVAHPPCQYLANSGVRWLYTDASRWNKMREGAAFFMKLLNVAIPKIVLENPIMHKHARAAATIPAPSQTIQPFQFGEFASKATCLWLKGLPLLVPTNDVGAEMRKLPKSQTHQVHRAPPGPNRWKERSRTYQGIANALAEQYG